jgi:hypothetical protein
MDGLERSRANLYGSFDAQMKDIGALIPHIFTLSPAHVRTALL